MIVIQMIEQSFVIFLKTNNWIPINTPITTISHKLHII